MTIDQTIFKAYDIRGIYPSQINEEVIYNLGRAYAKYLHMQHIPIFSCIAVSTDCRISSPALKQQFIKGLTDSGISVDDFGMLTTPTFYFRVGYINYFGGVQITASHNPKEYNGLKIVSKNAVPLSKSEMNEIKEIMLAKDFLDIEENPADVLALFTITAHAVDTLLNGLDLTAIKPFSIAIDTSNGMGSIDMHELFSRIPQCTVVELNYALDGNFPAHGEADPVKAKNLEQLSKTIVEQKLDFGIATDGDADRIVFVDETGTMMPTIILRAILAKIVLQTNPHAAIAFDLRPGRIIQDVIAEAGGKAIVTPVGAPLIKQIMRDNNAVFGGETSGHFMFQFPFGVMEAPIYLVVLMLIYIGKQNVSLSEIVRPFAIYANSGDINIEIANKDEATSKIQKVKERYADGKISELDGVSVEYPDYWFNLRPSNTEPLIRFTLEARSLELMQKMRDEIIGILKD